MDKIIHMEALQKQTVILEVLYAISCCVLPTKVIPHRESLKGIYIQEIAHLKGRNYA